MFHTHRTTLFKSILAGMMIALGAMAYLIVESPYVGAALFTIGLYVIYTFDFYLYTGKVGYFLEDRNLPKLIVIWIGNLIGTVGMGLLVQFTRLMDITTLHHHAVSYAEIKLSDNFLSIFILGLLCGLMMYIAAASFKKTQNTANSIGGYIGLFLCVLIFLLSGFEHSIANMFYFTVADVWTLSTIAPLLVVTLGNAAGGLLIPVLLIPTQQSGAHH